MEVLVTREFCASVVRSCALMFRVLKAVSIRSFALGCEFGNRL